MRMSSLLLLPLAAARWIPASRTVSMRRPVPDLATRLATPRSSLNPTSSTVSVFFARPVRALLSSPRRQDQFALAAPGSDSDSDSDTRIHALWRVLAQQLPADLRGEYGTAVGSLCLCHGKRRIESDEALDEVIDRAESNGAIPQLKLDFVDEAAAAAYAMLTKPDLRETRLDEMSHQINQISGHQISTEPRQLASCFAFVATPLDEPLIDAICEHLHQLLEQFGVRGTVYVAEEGLNAQLSVGESHLEGEWNTPPRSNLPLTPHPRFNAPLGLNAQLSVGESHLEGVNGWMEHTPPL